MSISAPNASRTCSCCLPFQLREDLILVACRSSLPRLPRVDLRKELKVWAGPLSQQDHHNNPVVAASSSLRLFICESISSGPIASPSHRPHILMWAIAPSSVLRRTTHPWLVVGPLGTVPWGIRMLDVLSFASVSPFGCGPNDGFKYWI